MIFASALIHKVQVRLITMALSRPKKYPLCNHRFYVLIPRPLLNIYECKYKLSKTFV